MDSQDQLMSFLPDFWFLEIPHRIRRLGLTIVQLMAAVGNLLLVSLIERHDKDVVGVVSSLIG